MKKILCLLSLLLLVSGCDSKIKEYSENLLYMDTYINIKVYSDDEGLAKKGLDEADKMFNDYDKLSDRYKEYDNLTNINYINNKLTVNQSIKIDDRLYKILEYSKSYYEKSNKLFNIALGNVIDVWAKYRNHEKSGIPSEDELKNSGSVDISALVLEGNDTIKKTSNISLDLGAIAKGYATEVIGDYFDSIGLHKYLITAGTSSVKAGDHYNGDRYKIGLTDPLKTDELYKVIKVKNKSITTSGSYERYYEYDGKTYSHIIDPISLYPPDYMLSVTVITDDAALGEILSTTLFLMPIDKGLEYIKNFDGVEALWYGLDGKVTASLGMSKYE
jgi:thiamine biosynthesis lipoprotein